jgi:hypothetical protein
MGLSCVALSVDVGIRKLCKSQVDLPLSCCATARFKQINVPEPLTDIAAHASNVIRLLPCHSKVQANLCTRAVDRRSCARDERHPSPTVPQQGSSKSLYPSRS